MSVVVVFYSRYNEQSLDFLQNIESIMDVRILCVDEKNVRQAIMNEEYSSCTIAFDFPLEWLLGKTKWNKRMFHVA